MTKSGGSILVIEDDPDVRDSVKMALEDEGYRVATASHGKEGLEYLDSYDSPSLILLDLMMPVMSGAEFLAAIRQHPFHAAIPVVILSAWGRAAARLDGIQGFVGKPVDLDVLLGFVRRFCGGAD
ncbi:MAG: response regulator [Deltaproteobacteria bacterium]|nr:response regulator [Deltaproteobacteria bacterium]